MPTFIGIDLAWQSDKNHSGAAVLHGDRRGVEVQEFSSDLTRLSDVKTFIYRNTRAETVVAIDAPLIVKNTCGQRPCETEIGRRFGAADAAAHTTNLKRYPGGGVQLARSLKSRGFLQCPQPRTSRVNGKWFFEVYPHPAHVVLLRLAKIIKYKKGSVASRRCGLAEFRQGLRQHLASGEPPLRSNAKLRAFLDQNLDELRGQALKHYEDKLDALFCAYLAAYFWVWGYERNEMIGDLDSGYIINPKAPAG